jgi:Adenylate and Guanylate cyclase catalytic domain
LWRVRQPLASPQQVATKFSSPEVYTPKHLAEKILTSKNALEGERKQVTVLFADLKGSMELLADRDPEEARKLFDAVIERMMEAVHWYEGTVNHILGDGIMALFGTPLAHEDHAVRASYAALRMQESVKRYAAEVQRIKPPLNGMQPAITTSNEENRHSSALRNFYRDSSSKQRQDIIAMIVLV